MANLKVKYETSDVDDVLMAYSLVMTVTEATDITDKIFVFHQDTEEATSFSHIASPLDIHEFPEDAPDIINNMPYFRLSTASLLFRSLGDLVETKKMISADISCLVRDMSNVTETPLEEEVTYDGTAPTDYF